MFLHSSWKFRPMVAFAVAAVASAVPSLGGAERSPAAAGTFPGRNGLLTFARSAPDGFDIVAMRRDGSRQVAGRVRQRVWVTATAGDP